MIVRMEKLKNMLKAMPLSATLYVSFSLLYYELLFRISVYRSLGAALLFIIPAALGIGLLMGILIDLLPLKIRKPLVLFVQLSMLAFFFSERIYYHFFKMIYPFSSLMKGAQIAQFYQEIFSVSLSLGFVLLFWIAPPILTACFFKPRDFDRKIYQNLLLALLCFFLAWLRVNFDQNSLNSTRDVFYNSRLLTVTGERLGMGTTFVLDVIRPVFEEIKPVNPLPDTSPFEEKLPEHSTSTAESPSSTAAQNAQTTKAPEQVYENNVLDVDFFELMQHYQGDSQAEDMIKFISKSVPTLQNDHSGLYEGYNLIFIVAESLSPYAIREDVTPTLAKMRDSGVTFENFYTQLWGVSTLDGEYSSLLGLIPKNGVWSMTHTADISTPLAPGNRLTRAGYSTRAYHNHYYNYYDRNISHPKLGYDYKGVGNGLDMVETWPESDLEMIEETFAEYVDDEPFHTYYLTVSGHMNYSFSGNMMSSKNRALVEDLPYSEESKAYLAAQIEFDRAMEKLLAGLEEAGSAERTLIVVCPDHYPYGLSEAAIAELGGVDSSDPIALMKSSLLMYVPGSKPEVVTKPCSSLDVLPTVYNLLGISYDSRLLSGRDIFSTSPALVPFADYSWITEKGMYRAEEGQFEATADFEGEVSADYLAAVDAEVEWRIRFGRFVLDTNFYRYALPESIWSTER